MKKGIVVYKSKYGSSKWYAEKIAEKCNLECKDLKQIKIDNFKDYEIIVFCGAVYASGVSYKKFLNKNFDKIKDKKIILFLNGASPYDEATFNNVVKSNFSSEIASLPIFYGRGMWDLEKMSFTHKVLCKMLIKMVAKKEGKELQPWEQALMEAKDKSCNWTDEKYIEPLVDCVLKLDKKQGE